MNRYEQIPSEIKCIYERLDPLLPAMPFTDASSALFVLMIFHATWFLTKKRISLLEKAGGWPPCASLTYLCDHHSEGCQAERGMARGDSWSHTSQGAFLVRVAARILLQQISQVWKPRAEYEDSTSRYETRCYTGTSLVVQWLRVHIPDSGAQVWSQVRELDPTSHR